MKKLTRAVRLIFPVSIRSSFSFFFRGGGVSDISGALRQYVGPVGLSFFFSSFAAVNMSLDKRYTM